MVTTPVNASGQVVTPTVGQAPFAAQTAAQATALASSSGQPVEVLPDRTDLSQTFAEPQGGFEATDSLVPQQVQQPDGTWVPVDPTLSVQSDGRVAPAAITTGLTLSDGGLVPRMVRLQILATRSSARSGHS
jgi:hypothetical protein